MKLCKYWARGRAPLENGSVSCFGGSNSSLEDAAQKALEAARRVAAAVARAGRAGRYTYLDRPLREEIIEEFHRDGAVSAAITRNGYGSLVLNAQNSMFIDIDCPEEGAFAALARWFNRLFGRPVAEHGDAQLQNIRLRAAGEPGLGLRIYRTRAGFRCLVTSREFDPASAETLGLLERFGSDPLYIKLCKIQECFRARLTPKFWRCRGTRPPPRIPWESPAQEARYRDWVNAYNEKARTHRACRFLEHLGPETVHPAVEPIVAIHDRFACAGGDSLA